MTPEAQRIAIAEDPRFQDRRSRMAIALGYEFDPMRGPPNSVWHKGDENRTHDWFERYFNDLNAMHEAEKVLVHACEANKGKPTTYDYWHNVWDLCGRSDIAVTFATAAQRAEAFLRTLGKWKE